MAIVSLISSGGNQFTASVDPDYLDLLREVINLRAKELDISRSSAFNSILPQKERLKDELERLRTEV